MIFARQTGIDFIQVRERFRASASDMLQSAVFQADIGAPWICPLQPAQVGVLQLPSRCQ